MKTCPSCQADNTDDAIYCKRCGRVLDESQSGLNEGVILLQIRDLLKQEVKQGEDIQKETKEYRNHERQYLERAERRARRNLWINVAAICFFVLLIIVILASYLFT